MTEEEKPEEAVVLSKAITKEIVNEFDRLVTRVVVTAINDEDGAVTANLYDKTDQLVARKRVYSMNVLPFETLTEEDRAILYPLPPEETVDGL